MWPTCRLSWAGLSCPLWKSRGQVLAPRPQKATVLEEKVLKEEAQLDRRPVGADPGGPGSLSDEETRTQPHADAACVRHRRSAATSRPSSGPSCGRLGPAAERRGGEGPWCLFRSPAGTLDGGPHGHDRTGTTHKTRDPASGAPSAKGALLQYAGPGKVGLVSHGGGSGPEALPEGPAGPGLRTEAPAGGGGTQRKA